LEIAAFCGIIAKKSQQNAFYKEDTPMRAYERLLKYVKIHTTSDPNSGTHPSTLRQFDLAKILVEELKEYCTNSPVLSSYKWPRIYNIVDSLPHTATGKIMHRALRNKA